MGEYSRNSSLMRFSVIALLPGNIVSLWRMSFAFVFSLNPISDIRGYATSPNDVHFHQVRRFESGWI